MAHDWPQRSPSPNICGRNGKLRPAPHTGMIAGQKIGVVTVTYNSARVIDGFLTSLLGQSKCDFVLYAVDNASSDETLARIGTYNDPRVRVIANEKNLGIAEANNQGIEAAL